MTAQARGSCADDPKCKRFIEKLAPSAQHLLKTKALLATVDLSRHQLSTEGCLEWELRPPQGVIDSKCVIYTDSSMVDGPTKAVGRVGFGFVAYDEEGAICAKAFGTPPCWIDSVPGAEAWAVAEALRNAVPGVSIWSDCLSVVKRFQSGQNAATASTVKLARLWATIFDV